MNSRVLGLQVAGFIFGLMSLAQLLRFTLHLDILVAGHVVPLWPSGVAFLVLAALSLWMWRLAKAPAS